MISDKAKRQSAAAKEILTKLGFHKKPTIPDPASSDSSGENA